MSIDAITEVSPDRTRPTRTTRTTRSAETTDKAHAGCAWTPSHVTRSFLGWGIVAGPLTVAVTLAQAFSRAGFDLTRHQWSLLENGHLGWIQSVNFALAGLMIVAFAVGLRRALRSGPGAAWAPRLAAVYGASLVTAGVFTADPALGFPIGTPDGPGQISGHGMIHFAAAGVGFVAIAVACLVLARRLSRDGARRLAWMSRLTGVAFLGGFACVASGAGSVAANLLFTATVVLVYAWITTVAVHYYRTLADVPTAR